MKCFEYKTVDAKSPDVFLNALNELGRKGWEVVAANHSGGNGQHWLGSALLKREYDDGN